MAEEQGAGETPGALAHPLGGENSDPVQKPSGAGLADAPQAEAGVLELTARSPEAPGTCPPRDLHREADLAPPRTPEPIAGSRVRFPALPPFTPATSAFSKVPDTL